jgi:hypothetical protein
MVTAYKKYGKSPSETVSDDKNVSFLQIGEKGPCPGTIENKNSLEWCVFDIEAE